MNSRVHFACIVAAMVTCGFAAADQPVSLTDRLQKILDRQVAVCDCTRHLHMTMVGKPRPQDEEEARRLAAIEEEILARLTTIRDMSEGDGFREVLQELRLEMERVRSRLKDTNVGADTQGIEQDVIETLKEMVAALTKR